MNRPILAITALILMIFSLFGDADAASRKRQTRPSEISTDFFSLTLPKGWKMLKPVKTHPNGDLSAVFVPDDASLAVTINIIHVKESARIIATTTADNIEKTGFTATTPKEENGLWQFDIKGKANGRAWFGSNGKICAIVLMFGANYPQANALLANLKPKDPAIFPANVD